MLRTVINVGHHRRQQCAILPLQEIDLTEIWNQVHEAVNIKLNVNRILKKIKST